MRTGIPVYLLLMAMAGTVSCAITPLTEQDMADDGEEPVGAGLISGDRGEIVFFKKEDRDTSFESTSTLKVPASGLSVEDGQEFEAFKRWLKARETGDTRYQEFLLWREFEANRLRLKSGTD